MKLLEVFTAVCLTCFGLPRTATAQEPREDGTFVVGVDGVVDQCDPVSLEYSSDAGSPELELAVEPDVC